MKFAPRFTNHCRILCPLMVVYRARAWGGPGALFPISHTFCQAFLAHAAHAPKSPFCPLSTPHLLRPGAPPLRKPSPSPTLSTCCPCGQGGITPPVCAPAPDLIQGLACGHRPMKGRMLGHCHYRSEEAPGRRQTRVIPSSLYTKHLIGCQPCARCHQAYRDEPDTVLGGGGRKQVNTMARKLQELCSLQIG